ncbi:MAG: PIN domain-containing protein [Coriobacteriales bacterium]|jgi:predicted nucleic acid-binding protein|nr:PIN domain-containing protein [Coriobacteriales bacterium]
MDLVLDTNIILDYLDRREGHFKLARKICLLGITKEANTYLTVNSLTDIHYLLQKGYGSQVAQEMMEANLGYLQLIGITPENAAAALAKRWGDYEDCLLAECASKIKADYIITRNVKDFELSEVPAITPTELFAKLEAQGFSYAAIDY